MNSPNDEHRELQRREQELQKREQELRLRELEAEINQPPLYKTVKHEQPESKLQRWGRKAILVGKFLAFVIVGYGVVKLGTIVASIAIVGAIAFIGYKIFLEGDRTRR
ncbi:MAG TPA: hypothetical protein DD379_19585 [Cyanobacteria bacterium UBA11162]|nr:hypothetical protein [Cyanobacteria bacterium UBA11162]